VNRNAINSAHDKGRYLMMAGARHNALTGRRLHGASALRVTFRCPMISHHYPKTADSLSIANKHGGRSS
jgi:hypothetical protein